MNTTLSPVEPVGMSDKEFLMFSSFIYDKVGILLSPNKKFMLEGRLNKRLKARRLPSFSEYANLLFNSNDLESELPHLIDVVTTNKTDFFREPAHYDYLSRVAIPDILARRDINGRSPIRIWSAGCSSGEEPYTLAMVLAELAEIRRDLSFTVLASDISTRILERARKAVYTKEQAEPIPLPCKMKYLLSSKDHSAALVRICSQLRSLVTFRRINFMDHTLDVRNKMDVIFCRNVIIYFDKPTQEALMRKFHQHLRDDGYLFLGHSESLNGSDVDFYPVASTVYRKLPPA